MTVFKGFWLKYFLDLANVIEDCQSLIQELDTGPTTWQKIIENLEENWENIRETIFTSTVCYFAPPSSPILCCRCAVNEAVLRCRECGVLQYLCVQCDNETHSSQPCMTVKCGWMDIFSISLLHNQCHTINTAYVARPPPPTLLFF